MTFYYNPSYDRFTCGGLLDQKVKVLILRTSRVRVEDQGRLGELELSGHVLGLGLERVYIPNNINSHAGDIWHHANGEYTSHCL